MLGHHFTFTAGHFFQSGHDDDDKIKKIEMMNKTNPGLEEREREKKTGGTFPTK